VLAWSTVLSQMGKCLGVAWAAVHTRRRSSTCLVHGFVKPGLFLGAASNATPWTTRSTSTLGGLWKYHEDHMDQFGFAWLALHRLPRFRLFSRAPINRGRVRARRLAGLGAGWRRVAGAAADAFYMNDVRADVPGPTRWT